MKFKCFQFKFWESGLIKRLLGWKLAVSRQTDGQASLPAAVDRELGFPDDPCCGGFVFEEIFLVNSTLLWLICFKVIFPC